jgi:signal transduction histidine kinase
VKKYASVFIHKKLALRLEPLNQTVVTDEKWLTFVIEQLLSNALKYTPEGTISIYMDPGEEKTLVIADTGIGIQPEDLPRLFEKGFTGYNGRMDKKSTGLGLYLCRSILKKLRHGISIRSALGQGTQVRVDLSRQPLEIE